MLLERQSVIDDGLEYRELPFNFNPKQIGISHLLEQAYSLRVEIEDEKGQREVFNDQMSAGEPLQAIFTIDGHAAIRVFVNDILFQAWEQ